MEIISSREWVVLKIGIASASPETDHDALAIAKDHVISMIDVRGFKTKDFLFDSGTGASGGLRRVWVSACMDMKDTKKTGQG